MISKDRFVNTMNRLQEIERKLDKVGCVRDGNDVPIDLST